MGDKQVEHLFNRSMTNQISNKNLSISIDVEGLIVKEEDYYVAYCPALELSGYGDTVEKAQESFEKEVEIFINETHERGTLEKYLLKNGWTLQQIPEVKYLPPKIHTGKSYGSIQSSVHKQVNIPVS